MTYACPDCNLSLDNLYCHGCHWEYSGVDGIPVLFPRDPRFRDVREIAQQYDAIYCQHPNVWESQGRTVEFIEYFSSLLNGFGAPRLLEIGCGEGHLLAALKAREKNATDLSLEALKKARTKARARFSRALAERLPFPSDYFDLVTSVGVMEHFLDIDASMREVRRVLKPGGRYVALTHVNLTLSERLFHKLSEYVFPRPRPIRLARWLGSRLAPGPKSEWVVQPIQQRYTTRQARDYFEHNGLSNVDVIHTRKFPRLPLVGPWVVIYIAQK